MFSWFVQSVCDGNAVSFHCVANEWCNSIMAQVLLATSFYRFVADIYSGLFSPLRHAMQQHVLPTCWNMKPVAFWWDSTQPYKKMQKKLNRFFISVYTGDDPKFNICTHLPDPPIWTRYLFALTKMFIKSGKFNSAIHLRWLSATNENFEYINRSSRIFRNL